MRLVAICAFAAAAAAGCAASARDARVALELQGVGAGAAERQRCIDAAQRAGAIVDATAPVQAVITLEPGGDRLQVISATRGLVREESQPAGAVERLCHDAALAAAVAHQAPLATPPAGSATAPERSPSPMTSGGGYQGPISN